MTLLSSNQVGYQSLNTNTPQKKLKNHIYIYIPYNRCRIGRLIDGYDPNFSDNLLDTLFDIDVDDLWSQFSFYYKKKNLPGDY